MARVVYLLPLQFGPIPYPLPQQHASLFFFMVRVADTVRVSNAALFFDVVHFSSLRPQSGLILKHRSGWKFKDLKVLNN